MDVLDIARWQFGIITVYHFLFVPLTIGLTAVIAGLETAWVRTGKEDYLRLTKFFGKLFLINFAIGVVTGIVQEFQFGMNWSDYSRFVGDVFGAPLAIEGLLAFFLESTFLGLWIFGWDKLPRGLHAACMWLVHLGTLASAWFILAANSWMQHPVGYGFNPDTGRAELDRLLGGDVQQGPAGDVPARDPRGVHDRRRVPARRRGLPLHEEEARGRPAAVPPGDPHRRGRHPARRHRRRGHRRPPGQGDDRGAADEDGGRRGPLRDRASAARRSPSSPSAPPTGRRRSSPSRSPACCPSSAPAPSTAKVEGINHAARAVRRDVRPGPGVAAYYTDGRLHPDHPGDLLVVPLHDRARLLRRGRRRADPVADPQGAVRPASGGSAWLGLSLPIATIARAAPGAGSSPRWAASRGSSSA